MLIDKQQETPATPPHLLSPSVEKDTEQSQSANTPEAELMQELINVLQWYKSLCFFPQVLQRIGVRVFQREIMALYGVFGAVSLTVVQRPSFVHVTPMKQYDISANVLSDNKSLFGDKFECYFLTYHTDRFGFIFPGSEISAVISDSFDWDYFFCRRS